MDVRGGAGTEAGRGFPHRRPGNSRVGRQPMEFAIEQEHMVSLTADSLLLRRDGSELTLRILPRPSAIMTAG